MSVQRITVSLPDYLYNLLLSKTNKREISSFVASALEEKILKKPQSLPRFSREDFFFLRKKLPKFTQKEILVNITKGRK
jgi:hypothetical protein